MANETEERPQEQSGSRQRRSLADFLADLRGQVLRRQADLATDPGRRRQDRALGRVAEELAQALELEEQGEKVLG